MPHHITPRAFFVVLPTSPSSGAVNATSSELSFLVVTVVSLMTRQQPCLETS